MNRTLVLRLVLKDWYLCRASLTLVALAGAFCIALLYLRNSASSYVGLVGALMRFPYTFAVPTPEPGICKFGDSTSCLAACASIRASA